MRIRWNNHPTDASKNGTLDNVSQQVADLLCATSQAERVVYKNYVDRLSAESPKAPAVPIEWGIKREGLNPPSILRRHGTECVWYKSPDGTDCPASVRRQFDEAVARSQGIAWRPGIYENQQKQNEQERKERLAICKMMPETISGNRK